MNGRAMIGWRDWPGDDSLSDDTLSDDSPGDESPGW